MSIPSDQKSTKPTDPAWCPSDHRVRCINCVYLAALPFNSAAGEQPETYCANEDGPVAHWHFLDGSEPKECWCSAFTPNDWLSLQQHLPIAKSALETDLLYALKNIVAAEHEFVGDTGIDWTDEITLAVKAAESVIAKAEAV
jgi:hypothetical protein